MYRVPIVAAGKAAGKISGTFGKAVDNVSNVGKAVGDVGNTVSKAVINTAKKFGKR